MVERRVQAWAADRPEAMHFFQKLNEHGWDWAIFSSLAVAFLVGDRQAADVDVLVSDEVPLADIATLLPNARLEREKRITIPTIDDKTLHLVADELTAQVDDTEVQIMRPVQHLSYDDHHYWLSLTEAARKKRLSYPVGETVVYVANPVDVYWAKAIMQRKPPKQDSNDARRLLSLCDLGSGYAVARAEEVGADYRVYDFARRCGAVAVSRNPHMAYLQQAA